MQSDNGPPQTRRKVVEGSDRKRPECGAALAASLHDDHGLRDKERANRAHDGRFQQPKRIVNPEDHILPEGDSELPAEASCCIQFAGDLQTFRGECPAELTHGYVKAGIDGPVHDWLRGEDRLGLHTDRYGAIAGPRCGTPGASSQVVSNHIQITREDLERLEGLLDGIRRTAAQDGIDIAALEEELGRAEIVDSDSIPADVIAMNSEVILEDLDTGKTAEYKLVWPHVRQASGNAVSLSVLAPLGMALLGYRSGDTIQWNVPRGVRRLRVVRVVRSAEAIRTAA